MTQLVLDLPADLYERLRELAGKQGKSSPEVARDLLAEQLPPPEPVDERTHAIAVLHAAGLLTELSPEEKKRAEQCTTTLEEVSAALDAAGGPPLSELILEMRGTQSMSHLFFDASALVKRYLHETGTMWVRRQLNPSAGNTVIVAEVTRVEVAAALAARHRAPGGTSRTMRDRAVGLLLKHCNTEYQIASLTSTMVSRAVTLTQNYRLRGYDAIQLATALELNTVLHAAGLSILTFVAADNDLIAAAQAEGLAADTPNNYP